MQARTSLLLLLVLSACARDATPAAPVTGSTAVPVPAATDSAPPTRAALPDAGAGAQGGGVRPGAV